MNCIQLDEMPTQGINIPEMQRSDDEINPIIEAIKNPDSVDKHLARKARRFVLKEDILYLPLYSKYEKNLVLYVPKALRKNVLTSTHDSLINGSHFGFARSYDKLKKHYFWPSMRADLQAHIASCISVQKINLRTQNMVSYNPSHHSYPEDHFRI